MRINYKHIPLMAALILLFFGLMDSNAQIKMKGAFTSGSLFSSGENFGIYQSAGQSFVGSSSSGHYRILSGAFFASPTLLTGVSDVFSGIPTEYELSQNYPNPFNPSTKMKFALPKSGLVKICVFDILGREVKTLLDQEMQAGYHKLNFNADGLPSGIYFYNIRASEFVQTKKMILLK